MIKGLICMKVKMPNLEGKNPILMVQLIFMVNNQIPFVKTIHII